MNDLVFLTGKLSFKKVAKSGEQLIKSNSIQHLHNNKVQREKMLKLVKNSHPSS